MRLAASIPVLMVLLAAAACGSSPPPKAPAPAPADGAGATSGQGSDTQANRPLTKEECQQLGQSIIDTCHGTNTRIATVEGWCSDVVAGVGSGSWVDDCVKHIKYVDAVCFSSTNSVGSMMDCDNSVSR